MAVPGTSADGNEASAFSLLDRADELDRQRRFTEATLFYEKGLQLLIDVIKATKVESKRNLLREKALQYMDRAEKLKEDLKHQQPTVKEEEIGDSAANFSEPSNLKTSSADSAKHHRIISIANNSTGFSYAKIFGEYLNHEVITVTVRDPYVRSIHQIYNFLRLCELLVKSCRNLRSVILVTTLEPDNLNSNVQQKNHLEEIRKSLLEREVDLLLEFSTTLHDREIRLSSGWIIKIGRGLDIYKPTSSKFSIGYCDYDLRRCHETTVNIYSADDVLN